jgi:multimeric flavodoxin WrbA
MRVILSGGENLKILGIVCSPRKGGNTEIMVREALGAAHNSGAETDIFLVSEKNIAPCDACDACLKTGVCLIKDDMQELYEKLIWADAIIFGTPVYFLNVTAQAKAIMDRTFAFLRVRKLSGKVATAIIVARRVGSGQVGSLLYSWFMSQGMVPVASALGYARYKGDITTGIGGSPADIPALEEARNLSTRVIQMVARLSKVQ